MQQKDLEKEEMKNAYHSPEVEVLEMVVEIGFAGSPYDDKVGGDNPVGGGNA